MVVLVRTYLPDCFIYCRCALKGTRSVEPTWSTGLHGHKERLRRLEVAAEDSTSKAAARARRAGTPPQLLQALARSQAERDPTSQEAAVLTQGWDLEEVAAVICTYLWASPRRWVS